MAIALDYTVMYLGTEPFFLLSVATDDEKGDRVNSDKRHVPKSSDSA